MEAAIAAAGYGAYYEGAQSFYAGYKTVYALYDTYNWLFPYQKPISDSTTPGGEFIPSGSLTVQPKRRVTRRRYSRRRLSGYRRW